MPLVLLVLVSLLSQQLGASVAGLLKAHAAGLVPAGSTVVCTVTGHGLKDPQWALKGADGSDVDPVRVPVDVVSAARALALE